MRWAASRFEKIDCYGQKKDWSKASESTAAFGRFIPPDGTGPTEFLYEGIMGVSGRPAAQLTPRPPSPVAELRQLWGTQFDTTNTQSLPAPAFAVYLNPTDGLEANTLALLQIHNSSYITLETRAVLVSATLFNPVLSTLISVRMIAEVPPGGGIVPLL